MSKVIWTTHLKERLRQRGLSPNWVDTAVRFPDQIKASSTTNSYQHLKLIHGYQVVAAVKRQGSDWIVTSAWWKPAGTTTTLPDRRLFLERWIDSFLRYLEHSFKPKK